MIEKLVAYWGGRIVGKQQLHSISSWIWCFLDPKTWRWWQLGQQNKHLQTIKGFLGHQEVGKLGIKIQTVKLASPPLTQCLQGHKSNVLPNPNLKASSSEILSHGSLILMELKDCRPEILLFWDLLECFPWALRFPMKSLITYMQIAVHHMVQRDFVQNLNITDPSQNKPSQSSEAHLEIEICNRTLWSSPPFLHHTFNTDFSGHSSTYQSRFHLNSVCFGKRWFRNELWIESRSNWRFNWDLASLEQIGISYERGYWLMTFFFQNWLWFLLKHSSEVFFSSILLIKTTDVQVFIWGWWLSRHKKKWSLQADSYYSQGFLDD